MGRNLRRVGWLTVIAVGALVGCHKSAVQHKETPDPMLVSQPPVVGRSSGGHANPTARTAAPSAPAGADAPAQ